MIGIGLMRKHLVEYNRGIRREYLIKGISKMKAEEVKKVFNERLTSVKMGDTIQGGKGKAPFDYYVPNTSSYDIPYDDQKFRDLMKPKEKVKKQAVKSNAPEPIAKKKVIIKKKVVDDKDIFKQKKRKLNEEILIEIKKTKNKDILTPLPITDPKLKRAFKKIYKSIEDPVVKKYKQILDEHNISTRGFKKDMGSRIRDIISSVRKNPNFVLKYND